MASVVVTGFPQPHSHHASMASHQSGHLTPTIPSIEMVPNPTFSFPIRPASGTLSQDTRRRPVSMHLSAPAAQGDKNPHKRTISALPSFSFNAGDASGRAEHDTEPASTDEPSTTTSASAKRGHRRGGSEFVGGDSRFGVSNAISSSPTKADMPTLPVPTPASPQSATRGHAHRRSEAISSRDFGHIMSLSDISPRLSSSLPSTPMGHPADSPLPSPALDRSSSAPMIEHGADTLAASVDDSSTRPPSRPRVEFVEKVEIIPRPLSTISSETESSYNTFRGHSVNNSISSVISLSAAGSPSSRARIRATSDTSVSSSTEQRSKARSSIEISKRIEKEGEWLKSKSSSQDISRPRTESPSVVAAPKREILRPATSEPAISFRVERPRPKSINYSLGFNRRRSEPSISASAADYSRLSALSLQEAMLRETDMPSANETRSERRWSTQKLKDWAVAKLHRKSRELKTSCVPSQGSESQPESTESLTVPGKVPISEPPVAETDLDAVFGVEAREDGEPRLGTPIARIEFNEPSLPQRDSSHFADFDDASPVVDLDAALGPMRTPPMGSGGHRRQLHSSRMAKGFTNQGGHFHRRAESEPALTLFEHGRTSTPPTTSMEDVFEEEEDEDEMASSSSKSDVVREETGMGVSVVDADQSAFGVNVSDGLRLGRGRWDGERANTSRTNSSPQLSVPTTDRAASLLGEVILEESGPAEASLHLVEIVELHEEPRASSLTKSSDSSAASTLLAAPCADPTIVEDTAVTMTPDTYPASTFSSPDFARRQGSFDTSRVGTSASSITDNRTMSSCATGGPYHEIRMSVDDVPSLTSSRSTMMSTMHANNTRPELSEQRLYAGTRKAGEPRQAAEPRKKRNSIQSLSHLVGTTFAARSTTFGDSRPQTAAAEGTGSDAPKKKEHRLKKLMFWRSKQSARQGQEPNKLRKEPRG